MDVIKMESELLQDQGGNQGFPPPQDPVPSLKNCDIIPHCWFFIKN